MDTAAFIRWEEEGCKTIGDDALIAEEVAVGEAGRNTRYDHCVLVGQSNDFSDGFVERCILRADCGCEAHDAVDLNLRVVDDGLQLIHEDLRVLVR